MKALRMDVQTPGCQQGKPIGIPRLGWVTRLSIKGQPKEIQVVVRPESMEDNVYALFYKDVMTVLDPNQEFDTTIHVNWVYRGFAQPDWTQSFDIFTFQKGGRMTQTQIGLAGRGKDIYATSQDLWSGMTVDRGTVDYTTDSPHHAYPGADYTRIWKGMAERVETFMREKEIKFAADAESAQWDAPDLASIPPMKTGKGRDWKRGIVLFSNFVTGFSHVLGEDDETYFVHFTKITESPAEWGSMKTLPPMTAVYFLPDAKDRAQRLTPVEACKLA